jgi:4-hydroxy-4-methyl-2-oxoglutarate aldolase
VITDPPVLKIRRHFPRPASEVIAAFAGASTGHLVDAMGGKGALDGRIKPLAGAPPNFCGVAMTCDAGPADNLAVFGALDCALPGDVIVAATAGHRHAAVIGDLIAGMARNCGVTAFVTDGVVRDAVGLVAVGLPVHCCGVSPNSPARSGPGVVGMPIVIGGVSVAPGDIVVGDADGVVIVPLASAADVAMKLAEVRKAEAALEAKVIAGLRMLDGVADLLKSDRVENIA